MEDGKWRMEYDGGVVKMMIMIMIMIVMIIRGGDENERRDVLHAGPLCCFAVVGD